MVICQYDVFMVSLDPTFGHEIKKTRPCLIVSPDEMNRLGSTVIVAPMTTKSLEFPTRVSIRFMGKDGWIVLDQILAVDRRRLVKKLGVVEPETIARVKKVLSELFVE